MKERYILLSGIVFVVLALVSYRATYALFSDTASSSSNTFSAAAVFPTESPTPTATPSGSPTPSETPSATPTPPVNIADHLVINEVVFDPPNSNACGSENDAEWIEIYNPTGATVNLDTWSVGDSSFTDDLPNVNIPAGGFAIVSDCLQSNFASIWPIPPGTIYIDIASAIGNAFNNAGEHVRLINGVTLIDSMSYGVNSDAFTPSVPAPVADHSLERNPDGTDTNTASDFVDRTTPQPGT